MTNFLAQASSRSAFRRTHRLAIVAALALPLAACDLDDLLTVPDPEVATPEVLAGESGLPILLAGAQSDFQVAFSGSSSAEGQIAISGLLTDELHYTSTFPTRIEVDRRSITDTNSSLEPIHRELQRARASAVRAVAAFAEFDEDSPDHAQSLNLLGYTYILFAENYCSGVPFSELTAEGETVYGQPQTTAEMLNAAVDVFEDAIAIATSADDEAQLNLARVGLGRALLNLGSYADAGAAVAAVPTDFVYNVEHSENSARENNAMYSFQWVEGRWAVADNQGTNGLPYRSDNDPRVPYMRGSVETGSDTIGFDESPLWVQLKYDSYSAPSVLASGVEARLIEAEAALQAGSTGTFLNILNALRASPPAYYDADHFPDIDTLGDLTLPATQAGRVDLLFKERAYWMYGTSHRLGDVRRLIRQYGRTQQSVLPVGDYGVWDPDSKDGQYGSDVNLPIPVDERNNENFPQMGSLCLDRNA
jgi:starch-binding outer membrane protein, SusD/RagB family